MRNLDHHQIDKNKNSKMKFPKEDINQKQDHLKKFKLLNSSYVMFVIVSFNFFQISFLFRGGCIVFQRLLMLIMFILLTK